MNWSCKAHGNPVPNITWYKDDQPLDGKPDINIKYSETLSSLQADSTLRLEHCNLGSEGATYRVEAENQAGKISHTFSLTGRNSHMNIPMSQ